MFVFGTAGHIDHGKTALIYALTGMDADRLPEEKERGMTIDLGFAWMDLPSGEKVGIVDVPGHENLVKNMIAGATGIDAFILVVDAHEGWMPQTEEHFQIIQLLAIQNGIMVITKVDLADQSQVDLVENRIQERLKDTVFHNAPIIRVSAAKNKGIDRLKSEIQSLIPRMKPKKDIDKPRLCIDRVFNIRGSGTVVTGTLSGGRLSVNQEVHIFPSDQKVRIRSIQTYKKQSSEAYPGSRVALNLAGIKKEDLRRGDVIFGYEPVTANRYIDVQLKIISGLSGFELKNGSVLDFFWETREIPAQMILEKKKKENDGEERYAQIRLKEALVTCIGDHFILRRPTPPLTVGGGIILDPLAEKHSFYDQQYRDFLKRRNHSRIDQLILSELKKKKLCLLKDFLVQSHYSRVDITETVQELRHAAKLTVADQWIVDSIYWNLQKDKLVDTLKKEYQKFPLEKNFQLNQIQSHFKFFPPRLFLFLIQSLVNSGDLGFNKGKIFNPSYQPSISSRNQEMIDQILTLFKDSPTNPPTEKNLSEQFPDSKEVVKYLIQENLIVKLDEGILLDRDNFQEMKERVINFLKANQSISIEEARDLLGMSRKYLIPFLERMDREGITIRKENRRFLVGDLKRQ